MNISLKPDSTLSGVVGALVGAEVGATVGVRDTYEVVPSPQMSKEPALMRRPQP